MKPVQKILTTVLWVLMVLIMVSVIGAGMWKRGSRADALNDIPPTAMATSPAGAPSIPGPADGITDVPPFELTDQNAKPVTLDSLKGKVWIADFVFTHCAGPCPMMTEKMAQLEKKITSPGVRFVSFSVDPERDTPAVLKEYAAAHHADESRWQFLTGTPAAIFATARGMLIVAQPASADSPILHSERFILVDAAGRMRKVYDSKDDAALAALQEDATRLGEQAAP